jgi:hypothetical protein
MIAALTWALSATVRAEKIPADAWQTGTLKDTSESWHSRSAGSIHSYQGNLHGAMASREYPIVHYIVETDQYIYEADLVLRRKGKEQPAVTVNGPIKFAVVKSDLYVQDEQKKEFKLVSLKKTLKTAVLEPAKQ